MHLAVPGGRVPATHGEHFEALQGLQGAWSRVGQDCSGTGPPQLPDPLCTDTPPSSLGSGAAGDRVAAPGSLEGCTQVVCSQWGPSPSPSSASRCLRDQRLVVSTEPLRGQTLLCLSGSRPSRSPDPLPHLQPQSPCSEPFCLTPMPPAPPRSPSVKTLRKDKELQSTPLKASDGSRLLSRSRTWRTWIRASRTVYGSVRKGKCY